VVIVRYNKQNLIIHIDDNLEGIPITYADLREQKGLAHALLKAEEQVNEEFMLMLGDNIL
jgi:glucose-1-phosphate thymidylyltransferase